MTYKKTLEKIHQLSGEMLSYSQQADWENVASTEMARQILLAQLATIEMTEFDEAAEVLLQKIIDINSQIEKLSRQEREECRQNYVNAKNKKNAIIAYSDF